MMRDRYRRAARQALRRIAEGRRPKVRALDAGQQATVIEALREEFDLLGRGEPNGHDVEAALQIAEAST